MAAGEDVIDGVTVATSDGGDTTVDVVRVGVAGVRGVWGVRDFRATALRLTVDVRLTVEVQLDFAWKIHRFSIL